MFAFRGPLVCFSTRTIRQLDYASQVTTDIRHTNANNNVVVHAAFRLGPHQLSRPAVGLQEIAAKQERDLEFAQL